MGFIRGAGIVILSVLLFLTFLGMNFAHTLDKSLDLEIIKSEVTGVFNESPMENISLDLIDDNYYKEYNCSFIDCFSVTNGSAPLFLISKMNKDYWHSKFYFFLLVSIIISVLIFILKEKRGGAFILFGVLLIVSSLPFLVLEQLFGIFGGEIANLIHILISQSYNIFIQGLIVGIILISIGIVFKIFGIGFKISRFFERFKKDKKEVKEIKKEVNKELKENSKVNTSIIKSKKIKGKKKK